MTKLVQAEDTDTASRRKIFDGVGFTFLNRLLKTGGLKLRLSVYIIGLNRNVKLDTCIYGYTPGPKFIKPC